MSRWFYRDGELATDGWTASVDSGIDGWQHTALRVTDLSEGEARDLPAEGLERLVIPLAGSFQVTYVLDGETTVVSLEGRESVFHGPTDVLYLPINVSAEISGKGRVAVAGAPARGNHPARYVPKSEVAVELRGAGRSSRQVHNFGTPGELDAEKFIVVEVITPAENWSSYPPHKHDEHRPGQETPLEEIYYFETAVSRGLDAPAGADPFALFATYSSSAGEIAINEIVRSGDIALVPYGYHGPVAAAPGYDVYYLNVMAGPGERQWHITDDPAHGWVREKWNDEPLDARLPYN